MIEVVAAVIQKNGKILITQRPDDVHLARLWEFPGGKVEAGESLERALQREIREELGVGIVVGDEFYTVEHEYPEKTVRLHFFNCEVRDGEPAALGVADLRWVSPGELPQFEFPPADKELIEKLQRSSTHPTRFFHREC
jgi:mutator protein MutT